MIFIAFLPATLLLGTLIGWYSKQLLNVLKSIRFQIKKKGLLDPMADIRVKSSIIAPKPPDEWDE